MSSTSRLWTKARLPLSPAPSLCSVGRPWSACSSSRKWLAATRIKSATSTTTSTRPCLSVTSSPGQSSSLDRRCRMTCSATTASTSSPCCATGKACLTRHHGRSGQSVLRQRLPVLSLCWGCSTTDPDRGTSERSRPHRSEGRVIRAQDWEQAQQHTPGIHWKPVLRLRAQGINPFAIDRFRIQKQTFGVYLPNSIRFE